ncbi:hypothetical protein [Niabella hirudinis]|uniref:hypothetical protein n=1 Tax=Niabella hirudinis TaxID=1285929 RepID=UPI003EBABE24
MNRNPLMRILFFGLLALTTSHLCAQWDFKTDYFKIRISNKGFITSMSNNAAGTHREFSPANQPSPLMQLYDGAKKIYYEPVKASYKATEKVLTLTYPNGSVARIRMALQQKYFRLELLSLSKREGIEAIQWGPYATTIDEKIGETIGVVRDREYAIGIQALNIKTLEGLPAGDDAGGFFIHPLPGQQVPDSVKAMIGKKIRVDVNKTGDMPEYVRFYRGTAAVKKDYGSELRFFSRDYRKARVIPVWEGPDMHKQYVEPIDVDFTGSAIALFGCPEPVTLDVIEKIELAEKLPHPELDGVWIKRSKVPGQAYLLNEGDPYKSIQYAKEAGFKLIHLGDFFESWGHFGLKTKRFPGGAADIKKATDFARGQGIGLGVHTLTMFTSANDPYITPVPSDSLCKTGSSRLSKALDKTGREIYIDDPVYFRYAGRTRTVKIGKELINYRSVSSEAPWRLLDCQRGAFGTTVSTHGQGDAIDKLTNNVYSGFYPDIHLQQQYAKRLAEVCNETGIDLMDFDGFPHGAASPTGHDLYAAGLFIDTWYKNLDRYRLNCGAGAFHYSWHILSFMNWGEPWYNALRESQVNYRIENQRYFDRNLMPGMLGWFSMTPNYRPEEIEWIQARSAGFNAGYLMRIDGSVEKSGFRDQLFSAIREWQEARDANVFSAQQRERMKDPKNEFHLERQTEKSWALYPIKLSRGFQHQYREVQTGEPLESSFQVVNPFEKQSLRFYITAVPVQNDPGATVSQIRLKVNGYQTLTLDVELRAGERIYCDGKKIYQCDNNWNKIKELNSGSIPVLEKNNNEVQVAAAFSSATAPKLEIEFKSAGAAEIVSR